jgi:hypothetical protein
MNSAHRLANQARLPLTVNTLHYTKASDLSATINTEDAHQGKFTAVGTEL